MIDIELLVDTALDIGEDYTTTYSGRGMFGATCFAIEVSAGIA